MEKRKKIIIAVVILLLIGIIVALSLGLQLKKSSGIKLEVWPHPDDNSETPLIQYSVSDAKSLQTWNNRLDEFLKEYRKDALKPSPQSANRMICSYTVTPSGDKVCDVPLDSYYPCTLKNNFEKSSPCLFFRLSKILNWTPAPFNSTEKGLPSNMPEDLKVHIKNVQNAPEANNMWLSCQGQDPTDQEFIGPIQYIPQRGFPVYYYPDTDKEGYLRPLVAVHFERPKRGVLIKIVCTAWARNIVNDANEQQGTIHFMLQVD